MKTNANIVCPKCGARRDHEGCDSVVYECYSSLYGNTLQPMTISINCLQRQIDQLSEKLNNALEQLLNK